MTTAPSLHQPIVVVTGAAGSLATDVIPYLRDQGWMVRGFDQHGETKVDVDDMVVGNVTDLDDVAGALDGAQAILHLAGIPLEDQWSNISSINIDGTYQVLEAARQAGVNRVVLASSIHAVGFHTVPADGAQLAADINARPDTLYGVSKVAMEALGAFFADKYGLDVVALRIAGRQPLPTHRRSFAGWLSPRDAGHLMDRALRADVVGYRVVWGVSRNKTSPFSLAASDPLEYNPIDDASNHEMPSHMEDPRQDPTTDWLQYVGGEFCSLTPPSMPTQS